jgi:hypothetical protein
MVNGMEWNNYSYKEEYTKLSKESALTREWRLALEEHNL